MNGKQNSHLQVANQQTQLEDGYSDARSLLDEIVRSGAQRMLQQAIEAEVEEYVSRHSGELDSAGHRLVVRNGRQPAREIKTGAGALRIRKPRVHDRREGHQFESLILPRYMRRSPKVDELVPWLYLKGISTGQMAGALEALLGPEAAGLSSTNVVRLKEVWQADYERWLKRDLSADRIVYVWADGIYFNVRLDTDRPCVLVLIGARADGRKVLLAIQDGERESELSWKELLLDLKARGLKDAPLLATGDGALGFWAALSKVFPRTKHQRCWVHKTKNVLNRLPRSQHAAAKGLLHQICQAPTRHEAKEHLNRFDELFDAKYPKAVDCVRKDEAQLLAFHDFPAEQWRHIRTTNPIESTFAGIRLRTRQTKGCGSRIATMTMVFKLGVEVQKRWRQLNGREQIAKLLNGVTFEDGIEVTPTKSKAKAAA